MAKLKQLVKRAEVEQAKRLRKCKFSSKDIEKDSVCMVVYEDSRDRYCYSKDVALKMIAQARTRLDDLEELLRG